MRIWESKIIYNIPEWYADSEHFMRFKTSTIILTNGCFDIIHRGHVNLLQSIKAHHGSGATLVVAVNSNASVRSLKGPARPLVPEDQRLAVIAALEAVDYCFLFDDLRCNEVIRLIRPHVWVKGGDYTLETLDASERAAAEEVGAQIVIHPNESGLSTTNIISRCQTAAAC